MSLPFEKFCCRVGIHGWSVGAIWKSKKVIENFTGWTNWNIPHVRYFFEKPQLGKDFIPELSLRCAWTFFLGRVCVRIEFFAKIVRCVRAFLLFMSTCARWLVVMMCVVCPCFYCVCLSVFSFSVCLFVCPSVFLTVFFEFELIFFLAFFFKFNLWYCTVHIFPSISGGPQAVHLK